MTLYSIAIVIACGIRVSTRTDFNNLSVCVKVYIFDWIEIFCFKIFVCNSRFYYQINKDEIKRADYDDEEQSKDNKKKKDKKKVRKFSFLMYIVENLPKITLYNGVVEYGIDFDDMMNRALFNGAAIAALNTALAVMKDKMQFDDFNIKDISEESSFRGVYTNGVIKFSLIKIFLYGLRIISVKRRFQTA